MEKGTIINRLNDFGYAYDMSKDDFSIEFAIEKVTQHILNATNCVEIPDGLNNIAVDMVCAEFLKLKKGFGQLTDIEFEQVASSIKLGDANVQFSNESTPEQKFDASISYLLNGHESDFARYRKLVW